MLLYINGDSHTAAAEAILPHAWAQDDTLLYHLGQAPHPYNLAVSWGVRLATRLAVDAKIDAQSGSSNYRILRTTRDWLQRTQHESDRLVLIQWSTWEREEWQYRDQWFQITASGTDSVPKKFRLRYKQFVASVDWQRVTEFWHDTIWDFHQELISQGVRHVFFNGNNTFSRVSNRHRWGPNYIGPYDPAATFDQMIKAAGHGPVRQNSWHFGPEGHRFWAGYMLQYLLDNNMVDRDAISLD
jgi:hypothetical protein